MGSMPGDVRETAFSEGCGVRIRRLITDRELAERMGCSVSLVRKLATKGPKRTGPGVVDLRMVPHAIVGNMRRWDEAAVDGALEEAGMGVVAAGEERAEARRPDRGGRGATPPRPGRRAPNTGKGRGAAPPNPAGEGKGK